ncbi:ACP phosphodiesterase [Campylobacterota bacterium]|nr:ACP phosphodiesterase [Campylobacterota bacterium]
MAGKQTIGILLGSLRRESFCRKIANEIARLFASDFDVKIIEIGELAMFNQDFDDDSKTPENWTAFRKQIAALNGVLFVTPEYNRSFPAVIKNAIDIASRPYGQNHWAGKAGAIISISLGTLGGFGANLHLAQPLGFLGVNLLRQPEMYIANIASILNENGELIDDHKRESLQRFVQAFTEWIAQSNHR